LEMKISFLFLKSENQIHLNVGLVFCLQIGKIATDMRPHHI
jgi:hypothetical protein